MDSAAVKSVIAIPVAKRDFMIPPPVHIFILSAGIQAAWHNLLIRVQRSRSAFRGLPRALVKQALQKQKKGEDSLESSPCVSLRLKGGALCLL